MKFLKSIIPFAILFIFGCTNEVKEISKEIDTNFDSELSTDLKSVVATMSFYKYAVPENYWYDEGTTARDILNDEFKFGYKRLSDLNKAVSQIETSNKQILASIDTLHNRITNEQRKIRKTQKALEQVNSMFGLGSIGGINALYDFASLTSNNKTDDVDRTRMPKEIQEALENLRETIQSSNSEFLFKTHQFEIKMIGSVKITDEQMTSIRLHLKKTIKEKVRQFYVGSDTTFINNSTLNLLNSYDELYSTKAKRDSNVEAVKLSNKEEISNATKDTNKKAENINSNYDLLQGKWQNTEDKSNFVVFVKNHRREISDGLNEWDDETFVLTDNSMGTSNAELKKEKDKYIYCEKSGLCWYIDKLNSTTLSLTYIAGMKVMDYKRVN